MRAIIVVKMDRRVGGGGPPERQFSVEGDGSLWDLAQRWAAERGICGLFRWSDAAGTLDGFDFGPGWGRGASRTNRGVPMRYLVKHHSEEFGCPYCGQPVYVGDRAYQAGPDAEPYCSRKCSESDSHGSPELADALARIAIEEWKEGRS